MNRNESSPGKVWLIGELKSRVEALDEDWSDVQILDQLRKIRATLDRLQREVTQSPS